MDITIHNIGIIKDAEITVDGLTVITGKNSSGKTTVGKLAYSLIKANCNAEESFESSKENYLETQLEKIRRLLSPTSYPLTTGFISRLKRDDNTEDELVRLFLRNYRMEGFEENYQLLNNLINCINTLTSEQILLLINTKEYDNELMKIHIKRYQEQFEEIKKTAIDICKQTVDALESSDSYRTYLHQRTKDFLLYHFNNQIKPVRNMRSVSNVVVTQKGNKCIGIKIKAGNNFVYEKTSSFVFPVTQAVFLDDPFALDRIDDEENRLSKAHSLKAIDNMIHPIDLQSYSTELKYILLNKRSRNFFDELELQRRYHSIFEKINAIVPGELQITDDGLFYLNEGIKLNIHNLATGSKLFFILKRLLLNGYLDDTLLVLDEPESHLHPEWIQKFAEIITLLVKELRVKIILTTHSPDLLLALSVYTKDYGIDDRSHYYLAKTIEGSWEATIDSIDNNINEGYAHLTIPLLEMNVRNQRQIKEN